MREGEGERKGGEEERWGAGREIMRFIYKQMKIEENLEIVRTIFLVTNLFVSHRTLRCNGGNQTGVLVQGCFC
jgi:hypothetical protein